MICNRYKLVEQDGEIDGISHSICSRCNFCASDSPMYVSVEDLDKEHLKDLREFIQDEINQGVEWQGFDDPKIKDFSLELLEIYEKELQKIKIESEITRIDKR